VPSRIFNRACCTPSPETSGDRRIFVLAANLIDFVNIDNAGLGSGYVPIRCLEQLEDNVFNILTYISGFGQGGRVHDGERYIQHLRQGVRQQGLAASSWTYEEDVRLRELHIVAPRPVHLDALVVVVNRYRQLLFSLILPDNVLIEKALHLLRFGQVCGCSTGLSFAPVIFQDGVADRDALVTDVGPRIVAW
jgi:hypothetical protein